MVRIRIDTDFAREVGRQLRSCGDRIDEMGDDLRGAIRRLDTWAWDGRSRRRAEPMLNRVHRESGDVARGLGDLGRTLQRVADTFEQEDSTAAGNLAGMPWVVFSTETPGAGIIIGGGIVIIGSAFVGLLWWWEQDLEGMSTDEALEKVEGILRKTPAGREALEKAEELGVEFELSSPGDGTWYDPVTNKMYVDPSTNQDLAAQSYVHELTHAKQHANGRFPDPSSTTRDEYVEKSLECEAEALVAEFEYEKERWLLDTVMGSEAERAYWKAYRSKTKELEVSSPEMSEDDRHKLAYEAGKEQVLEHYRDGSLRTSTTGQSYVEYYGEAWDRRNAV